MNIYQNIQQLKTVGKKQLALLIDPDKCHKPYEHLTNILQKAHQQRVDYLLVGGSLTFNPIDEVVQYIKQHTDIPVVLFPGSILQVSQYADALLFLSLISGRNPDFLIGNHVTVAPLLKKSGLQIIPTGYMLIDGGRFTSVEYMSFSRPIPNDKHDIATATAMAGEMLGLHMLYLEAGSGALQHIPTAMIQAVSKNVNIPVIVGGGIRSAHDAYNLWYAGADVLVVGTAIESSTQFIELLIQERNKF